MKIVFTSIISWFFVFQAVSQEQPVLEWANEFHISGVDSGLVINDHTVDQNNNSYVLGLYSGVFDFDPSANEAIFSTSSSSEVDFYVAKYDSEGNYLWCFTIKDVGYGQTKNIAVDNNSNIYITGVFSSTIDFDSSVGVTELSPAVDQDFFIAKYDSDGNFIWANSMPCTGNSSVEDLELDRSNEKIYLTGYFYDTIDFDPSTNSDEYTAKSSDNYDIYIAKYDLDGNYEWAHQIAKGGIGAGYYPKLAVDEETADVYLTGHFVDTVQFDIDSIASQTIAYGTSIDDNEDVFIVKYTSEGGFQWVSLLNGEGRQYIADLKVNNGELYCVGGAVEELIFSNNDTSYTIITDIYANNPIVVKLNNSGGLVDAFDISSNDGLGGASQLEFIDTNHFIFVGRIFNTFDFDPSSNNTQTYSESNEKRIFIAKYDKNLNFKYVKTLKGSGSNHEALGISSYEGSNSFSITGNFLTSIDLNPSEDDEYLLENNDINRKWFLAKYKESSVSLEEQIFKEQQINLYPNPSTEMHTLQLDGFDKKNMRIEMYDIQGRKLSTVHDGVVSDAQTFEVSVSSLNAGLYFYKVFSENGEQSIRFVKQ